MHYSHCNKYSSQGYYSHCNKYSSQGDKHKRGTCLRSATRIAFVLRDNHIKLKQLQRVTPTSDLIPVLDEWQ